MSKLENGSHTQFWGNVRIRRKSILGYITVTVTVWAHSPLYLVACLILFLPSRHRMLGDQVEKKNVEMLLRCSSAVNFIQINTNNMLIFEVIEN